MQTIAKMARFTSAPSFKFNGGATSKSFKIIFAKTQKYTYLETEFFKKDIDLLNWNNLNISDR